MITSKQRAALRAMANTLEPVFQIGKSGLTGVIISQLDLALEARELIKVTVHETADLSAKEALTELCEKLRAEPVQHIGRKLVLFRRSRENPRIEI